MPMHDACIARSLLPSACAACLWALASKAGDGTPHGPACRKGLLHLRGRYVRGTLCMMDPYGWQEGSLHALEKEDNGSAIACTHAPSINIHLSLILERASTDASD